MKNITKPKIQLLTLEHAYLCGEHIARNTQTSGVGETPIFTMRSRNEHVDPNFFTEIFTKSWSTPVGIHGWGRGWGAFAGEKMIASIGVDSARLHQNQLHRVLLGMGIEKEFRGQGLGSEMLKTCIEWCQQQPFIKWIDLGVFAENYPARALYKKFGFIETGRIQDCFRIDGHKVDDIQMSLEL